MSCEKVLVVGEIRQEERRGWCRSCPKCNEDIRYTVINLVSGAEPFLYCEKGSDFVFRVEDKEAIEAATPFGGQASLETLREYYEELEKELPPSPTGGRFKTWANIKCPGCGFEFPYAGGRRDETTRYYDSKIVWIEGAIAFRGSKAPSSRLVKVQT